MPVQFTTGTINQPDAGSVGLAMVEQIRDDLVAHAGWDLVEEYAPSGGVMKWYVFKNLAASSGLASDYFFVIGRRLSDGVLFSHLAEEYNTGTKILKYYAPFQNWYTGLVYDSLGRYTAEFTLSSTVPSGNPHPSYAIWSPAGTSTKWWLCVYDDGVAISFNGASNGYMQAGVYEVMAQTSIPMPLMLTGWSHTMGAEYLGLTRNPAVAGATFYASALCGVVSRWLGWPGDWRWNDKLQNNQRPAGEAGFSVYEYNIGDRQFQGGAIGKIKHMRGTDGQVPPAISFGDAFVLEDRLWVQWHPSYPKVWDTGVASS